MYLNIEKRAQNGKAYLNSLRRVGDIPAVVYSKEENFPVRVSGVEFGQFLREHRKGTLSTVIFHLKDGAGFEVKAVVKGVHYHPTTYQLMHLDFQILEEGKSLVLNVPIFCDNVVDCVGIKQGGFLRQVVRMVKVVCKPEHIPTSFSLDVKEMRIRQSKSLSDIKLPEGVDFAKKVDTVVVTIAKR